MTTVMRMFTLAAALGAIVVMVGCGDNANNAPAACGNGIVDGTEQCDEGASNGATGAACTASCQFTCSSNADCNDGNLCNGAETCTDHVCAAATPVADGTSCATGRVCRASACVAESCGNTVVEADEDCDGGVGCKADCSFLCSDSPATQCAGAAPACQKFACATDHTCITVADRELDGMTCDLDHPEEVCGAGVCALASCGNGALDPGEQCDDGAQLNLDGCDSGCQFEQAQRITALLQQFAPDAFCTSNALGEAITELGQGVIQPTWDAPVKDGTLSVAFKFMGLTDLTGQTSTFTLGFVRSMPAGVSVNTDLTNTCENNVCEIDPAQPGLGDPVNCPQDCVSLGYDGTSDLDWWYVRDPTSVDATETPLVQLEGQIVDGHLTAGPGRLELDLPFVLQPAHVTLFNARVDATIDPSTVNAPTLSSTGSTPGHLASENLRSSVTSFASSEATGAMCSDVSALSLATTPMPSLLRITCADAEAAPIYDETNRLIDVFISGCRIFGQQPGVNITQPDGALDGAEYRFAADPATRRVTSCTRNGQAAVLDDCLNNATYSSYFKFGTNRVILKRD